MTSGYSQNGASVFSLKEHDAKFHKNGFDPKTMSCKFREKLAEFDKVDDLNGAAAAYRQYENDSAAGIVRDMGLSKGVNAKDVLSGQQLEDAMQDYEIALGLVDGAKNAEVRKSLEKLVEKAEKNLEEAVANLKQCIGKMNGAGGANVKQFGPNASLAHDDKNFPDENDGSWIRALDNYGDSAYGWREVGSGSTGPHYIDYNGKRYYVKKDGFSSHANYGKDACENEVNANKFLRLAGIHAPDAKLYDNAAGTFCVTEEADISKGYLISNATDKSIREKAMDTYPIMTLLYNMDVMQNSNNAYVDSNGHPVFIDNGSTFGFSAKGDRNRHFNFDNRTSPFVKPSTDGGLTGLLDVRVNGYPTSGSRNWERILKDTDKESLLKLCAKYNMLDLVNQAEKEGLLTSLRGKGVQSLKEYAKALDDASAKYKTRQTAHQQQTQTTGQTQNQGNQQGQTGASQNVQPLVAGKPIPSALLNVLLGMVSPGNEKKLDNVHDAGGMSFITSAFLDATAQQVANVIPSGYSVFQEEGFKNTGVFVVGNSSDAQVWNGIGYATVQPSSATGSTSSTSGISSTNTSSSNNASSTFTAPSPWSQLGLNAYTQSQANGVNTLAQRCGLSTPTITKNANGTLTISGANGSAANVQQFANLLNQNGFFYGMHAMVAPNGQVAVVPFPTPSNIASALNSQFGTTHMSSSFQPVNIGGNPGFFMSGWPQNSNAAASAVTNLINGGNTFPGYNATTQQMPNGQGWAVVLVPATQQTQPATGIPSPSVATGVASSGVTPVTATGATGTSGTPGTSPSSSSPSRNSQQQAPSATVGSTTNSQSSTNTPPTAPQAQQTQQTVQKQQQIQRQVAAIQSMPQSMRENAIKALKRRVEDASLAQSKRDAYIAILKAVDPTYQPSHATPASQASNVPANPFSSQQTGSSQQGKQPQTQNASSNGQSYTIHSSGGVQDAASLAANPNAASLTTYYPSNKAIAEAARKIGDAWVDSSGNPAPLQDVSGFIRNLTDIFEGKYTPLEVSRAIEPIRKALPNSHPIVQALDKYIQTGNLPEKSKSWVEGGKHGQSILSALNQSGIGYKFGSGQWTPAKRSAGGVISGITIPRKGVRGVVNAMNEKLAPLGLKARIMNSANGDGDIIISTSNKAIAAAALSSAGIDPTPNIAANTGTQSAQQAQPTPTSAQQPQPQTVPPNPFASTQSGQQAPQGSANAYNGFVPKTDPVTPIGRTLWALINSPATTPTAKATYQKALDKWAKDRNGNI